VGIGVVFRSGVEAAEFLPGRYEEGGGDGGVFDGSLKGYHGGGGGGCGGGE